MYYYNVALGEEMYCKLHPNWLGSIDSVEFNQLPLWKKNVKYFTNTIYVLK